MVSRLHLQLKAHDRSYFSILKKEIHTLALSAGLNNKRVSELDIIVAELASNLAKHGGGGDILVKLIEHNGIQGIEIIGIDNGPGITDVRKMMEDGISTRQTLGQGLGAMKRLSDVFQVYSLANWGTVVLSRIFSQAITPQARTKIEVSAIITALKGDIYSGDGFYTDQKKNCYRFFIGDGLGHGKEAEMAVEEAGRCFLQSEMLEPVDLLREMHLAVKKTRGLVGTIAVMNTETKNWKICGVGNISARLFTGIDGRNYNPYNGIIGLNMPNTMNAQVLPYEKGQYLVMCSDGLKSRWDLFRYPGILRYDLSILAACLLKDFSRKTDDSSVAICKINL